jgi:hypothetical protein
MNKGFEKIVVDLGLAEKYEARGASRVLELARQGYTPDAIEKMLKADKKPKQAKPVATKP